MMLQSSGCGRRPGLSVLAVALLPFALGTAAEANDCSTSTRNSHCRVQIDREIPVSPLPVEVAPHARVTLQVTKRPLETIVFKVELADTAVPDPIAAIFAAFITPLQSVVSSRPVVQPGPAGPVGPTPPRPPPPAPPDPIEKALDDVIAEHQRIKASLDATVGAVKAAGELVRVMRLQKAGTWNQSWFVSRRLQVWCVVRDAEPTFGGSCGAPAGGVGTRLLPSGSLLVLEKPIETIVANVAALGPAARLKYIAKLEAVVSNQERLKASVMSLQTAQKALLDVTDILAGIDANALLPTTKPLDHELIGPFDARTNRTATIEIGAKDLLSKEVTPLAKVVVRWGGTQWEVSGGAMFSATPARDFANAPIVENGAPRRDEGGVLTRVTETQTRPMVVPAAFAHYRLWEVPLPDGQRFALLGTGAVGVNPYSKSADFGYGLSLCYRGFMVTPMFHRVREVRLTGGLEPGDELGSAAPDLPTERHWVTKFAVGLSYRIPF